MTTRFVVVVGVSSRIDIFLVVLSRTASAAALALVPNKNIFLVVVVVVGARRTVVKRVVVVVVVGALRGQDNTVVFLFVGSVFYLCAGTFPFVATPPSP